MQGCSSEDLGGVCELGLWIKGLSHTAVFLVVMPLVMEGV